MFLEILSSVVIVFMMSMVSAVSPSLDKTNPFVIH